MRDSYHVNKIRARQRRSPVLCCSFIRQHSQLPNKDADEDEENHEDD